MSDSGLTRTFVLILLAAGLVYMPLSRGSSADRPDGEAGIALQSAAPIDRNVERRPSLTGGDDAHGGEVPDAITLLGEFTNLDVTPSAVLNYTAQIVEQIPELCRTEAADARAGCLARLARASGLLRGLQMSDIGLSPNVGDQVGGLIECVRRSRGDGPSIDSDHRCARDALTRSAQNVLDDLKRSLVEPVTDQLVREALRTVAKGSREAAEAEEGSRSPVTEALAMAAVKQAVVGDLGYDVHFFVATLADACDSYTGGAFDPALESIRRAVEVDQYVLDRFFFPDWKPGTSPNRTGSQCSGTLHEQHPGVVVFRRDPRPDKPDKPPASLLVLFAIPETATAGIHPAAFVRAIRFIARWNDTPPSLSDRDWTIRIIGPTFSGSSASLARAIRSFPPGLADGYDFDVISGSATAPENLGVLTTATASNGNVRFSATTLSDDPMIARLNDLLAKIGLPVEDTAQLFESNTAYGESIAASARERIEKGRLGQPNANRKRPLELTFPLHISRIRSLGPEVASAAALQLNESKPLALEEAQTPKDLLPPLRPATTTPSAELMLRNLLQAVRLEGVRAVGVFATDIRDKLYLARELRRRAPDALLYTSESDVLFAHPSSTPFTRGMLVVSSYPLYHHNQAWTADDRKRREFPSMFAAGTYNATVLHLRTLGSKNSLPLSEFGLPFKRCDKGCSPPVWVNIVGRNRLWPVEVSESNANVAESERDPSKPAYTPAQVSLSEPPRNVDFATPFSTALLFVCLTMVAWLHLTAFWSRSIVMSGVPIIERFARQPSASKGNSVIQRSMNFDESRSFLACFAALTLLYMAAAGLFWTWFVYGAKDGLMLPLLVLVPVFGALLGLLVTTAWVTWHVVSTGVRQLGTGRGEDQDPWWSRAIYRAGCAVVIGLAVGFNAAYAASLWPLHLWLTTPAEADLPYVLFFERATSLTSGVSPLVPVLLLTAAGYFWGALHLCRVGVSHDRRITDRLVAWGDLARASSAGHFSRLQFPAVLALIVTIVVLVCWWTLSPRWPVTVEGWVFNHAIFWTVIVLQVLIAIATARLLHDHRLIQRYLNGFAAEPIVAACQRLPEHMVAPTNLLVGARLREAEFLISKWKEIDDRLSSLLPVAAIPLQSDTSETSGALVKDELAPLRANSQQIQETFAVERSAPETVWRDSKTRAHVRIATTGLAHWCAAPGRLMQSSPDDDSAMMRLVEECVALQTIFGLRDAFSQLASTAVFIMVAAILLLASHTLYPMQPRQTLLAITWTNIGVALLVGLAGLVAVNRNRVLSAVTRRPRGAIGWNWTLAGRIALFIMLPLLSVIAAQFPELAPTVLRWIEPMQDVLF